LNIILLSYINKSADHYPSLEGADVGVGTADDETQVGDGADEERAA